MRRGEILALGWGDVDWGGRRIWVRRSVGSDGRFQQPKTRGSVRAIAATPTLVSALRLHRMASGFKGEEDLIFPSERGTPLDGRNMVRRFFEADQSYGEASDRLEKALFANSTTESSAAPSRSLRHIRLGS
jgi:integrase